MISKALKPASLLFNSVIYALIFGILLSSCTTVTSHKIELKNLKGNDMRIDNAEYLVLNNGSFISVAGKFVQLKKTYKGNENVLVVIDNSVYKTIRDSVNVRKYTVYNEDLYLLDSVKEIYFTKTETDATGTVMVVIGSILGAALMLVIIGGIYFSNHPIHSCPFIYSFDGEKFVMDAEPLGGAVCEGLERTDISKLENLKNVDSVFMVRVRNVNDEQQKLDKIEFFTVNHGINEFTAPDNNGNFFKYFDPVRPQFAVNESGIEISKFIDNRDGSRWFHELPPDTSMLNYNPKETLTIRFPKPAGVKNAMLIINGGASYFGSNMIPEILKLNGNKIDEVYKSIYPGSEAQKNLFIAMHRDESYYMDIKISTGGELINQGILKSNGPIAYEDILYPLNLENIDTDYIEIVLTPQRYFWKFDMINIIYNYEPVGKDDIRKLDMINAVDNYGNELKGVLSEKDKDYYNMPLTGDYADILLEVPELYDGAASDIYVSTSGWYEINLKKDMKRDERQVEKILYSPGGVFYYALELYVSKLLTLASELNSDN